ncbi:MAG: hypothetical protein ACK5L3_08705 [Oscillospiraceae bacterium]
MDRPTLKKYICNHFARSTELEQLEANKIILLTAAGVIVGSLSTADEKTTDKNDIVTLLAKKTGDGYLEEYALPNNKPLPDTDGYIPLKDVVLKSGPDSINLPRLIVFFDEIIGITFGQID